MFEGCVFTDLAGLSDWQDFIGKIVVGVHAGVHRQVALVSKVSGGREWDLRTASATAQKLWGRAE